MNKIDLSKYAKQYEKKANETINEATIELLWEVIKKSPVDTWEFLKWNKRELAKKEWDKIVWSVYNDSKNANNVENWWRVTEVNWHKNRKAWWPVIHTWIWATPFLRTYLEKREKIKQDFINNLKIW